MQNQYTFNCKTADIDKRIDTWIYSSELKEIVEAFGGTFPDTDNRHKMAKWLLDFSECWDYRNHQKNAHDKKTGENARWQISSSKITEAQKNAVSNGIYALGLIGISSPSETDFDYIITLGGARFSCLYRPVTCTSSFPIRELPPKRQFKSVRHSLFYLFSFSLTGFRKPLIASFKFLTVFPFFFKKIDQFCQIIP